MLKCNACWLELDGKSIVTACQHLFCLKCAQQIVENDSGCSICESAITKSTVKLIENTPDVAACQLLLCGQTPEASFAAALASVQFYIAQQQLQAELRESQLTKKVTKVQEACRKKLEEVHSGYVQAKRKYEDVYRAHQQLQLDQQDLQAKYAQKAMQARKLQEALKKAHEEIASLRQSGGQGHGQMMGGGGGSSHGRSMSPLGQPAQLVTTVKRTEVFANVQSPPNLFGNPMQQGRIQQGMTGGFRASQGGNGGGGGFLGGSMDPNSPSGFMLGGTQAPNRPGSAGSMGARGGVAVQHVTGVIGAGSQNPHNQGMRKLLGMPPAPNGMGPGRNAGAMRNDLFSL